MVTHFLKGPIPWWWLQRAAELPGQALLVGLVLWLWAGMRRSNTVRLAARSFPAATSRYTVYKGLKALEAAGLVTVERRRGHIPLVTISEKDAAPHTPRKSQRGRPATE